jgi:hypothetical protein
MSVVQNGQCNTIVYQAMRTPLAGAEPNRKQPSTPYSTA